MSAGFRAVTLLVLAGAVYALDTPGIATGVEPIGPKDNLITDVLGLTGELKEQHYGGYITLNGTTKKLFYYLATSRGDPSTDPLVLWLNGGPGSSSLIGWGEENGPFKLALEFEDPSNPGLMPSAVSLTTNPYSWNTAANVLYFDQPAGTGLSWSENPEDYSTNDTNAQADMHQAMLQWFETYPYFLDHEFYITGESYAGTYIPLLATAILESNADPAYPDIDLQGIFMGNPVTYDLLDNVDMFQIYTFLSLIPLSLNEQLVAANCDNGANSGASVSYPTNPLNADYVNFTSNVATCDDYKNEFDTLTSNLYGYNLLADSFYGQGTFEITLFNELKQNLSAAGFNWTDAYTGTQANSANSDDRATTFYFNQAEVREAIHADPVQDAGFFTFGNARVIYTYDFFNTIPLNQELINSGVRVTVFSGDHDGIDGVPWPGSQTWTTLVGEQLGVLSDWTPWYRPDPSNYGQQTAGYMVQYNGLTYATVRGAGHQVPTYKPAEAYILFENFLANTLNSTTTQTVPVLELPTPLA